MTTATSSGRAVSWAPEMRAALTANSSVRSGNRAAARIQAWATATSMPSIPMVSAASSQSAASWAGETTPDARSSQTVERNDSDRTATGSRRERTADAWRVARSDRAWIRITLALAGFSG